MTMGDPRAVLALFAQSLSVPEPQRSDAEKQLESLQQSSVPATFVLGLCEHILVLPPSPPPSIDASVRLLACIWIKHLAKRNWKTTRQWTDDERMQVRSVLLAAALHEPLANVATQLALIIATIARTEFPAQWPFEQLFPPLTQALQASATPLYRRRGVELTYRLVKELATRRLLVHRKQFAMLAVELLSLALGHWRALAQTIDASADETLLSELLTTTKLLSTLLLHAFRDLARLENGELVRATFELFYEQLERLVTLRTSTSSDVLDKLCFRMAQLVVAIQKAYPIEYRSYLSPFLSLFWNVLALPVESPSAVALPKRLQIEAIQFVANVLSCRLYKREALSSELTGDSSSIVTKVITAAGDVNLTDAMVLEAQSVVDAFVNERLERLVHVVVLHYLKLQENELDEWRNDPEAFMILSESLTSQESVRACAEDLFLTLLQNYPRSTIRVLTQLTTATASWLSELNHNTTRVLDIDAVLLAIGLGCYDLHECFEFEPWFLAHLVPLLTNPGTGSIDGVPVLPYRVVWLVSCWLAQLTASVRAPLYDALLSTPGTDTALQLRIVQTLESMVGDWGFERDAFLPFLPRSLASLYAFFPHTRESESKMKVLACLEAMLQACGPAVVSVCHDISAPLPAMWTTGGEAENLVRGKILQLLTQLLSCVHDCEPETAQQYADQLSTLYAMCLEVVRFATDVSNPDEVFLMESGLELWNETLAVAPAYTPDLHALFANALRLMDRDYEHVQLVLTVIQHYIKLGKAQFWQTYHTGVGTLVEQLVGNVKAEASIQLATTVELVVVTYPTDQLVQCVPVITKMITACLTYAQRQAADARDVEPESVVLTYLSVVARLWTHHLEFSVVHVLHQDMAALVGVLDLMLDKFFSASLPLKRRKTWALGLSGVLDLVEEPILERLGVILEACVDVLDEERFLREQDKETEEDEAGAYRAYQSHQRKKQQIIDHTDDQIDLRAIIRGKLAVVNSRLGDTVFQQLLQTIDASVLAKLQ